jgi:uncharacterized damage-inducible protein DinB
MLYNKITDFLSDWNYDSQATLKIFKALTQESLNTEVTPGERNIGFIAWHITNAIPEMINRTSLSIDGFDEEAEYPQDINAIIESYELYSKKLADEISSKWNDTDLEKEVNMYGQMWKNGTTLQILISHQIHHRGQLTVLMRQAGLKVPGIMGPSKEEWAAMGMPTQK